jgi:TctA family transporter
VVVLLGADRLSIAGQSVNTATEYLVAVSALSPADRVQSLVAAAVTPSDCA